MSVAMATIRAGVCGFVTRVRAESDDSWQVAFTIDSDCEKVSAFASELMALGPIAAFDELRLGADGAILGTSRQHLKGCCSACVTPDGVFKAMQVSAGLALPVPVSIELESAD
jgi:hypothetical protein